MYRFERDEGARLAIGAFGDIAMFRANDLFQNFSYMFLRDFTGDDAETDRQKMLGAARGTWDYERLQPSPPGWPILPRTDGDPTAYWKVGLKRVKYMQTYLTDPSIVSLQKEWLDWARIKTPQDTATDAGKALKGVLFKVCYLSPFFPCHLPNINGHHGTRGHASPKTSSFPWDSACPIAPEWYPWFE